MGTVKGQGMLRHRFWGEYSCVIAIDFGSPEAARDAAKVLGDNWQSGVKSAQVLVAELSSGALDVFKTRAGRWGADVRKIDSVAKSVDYGEPFEVTIPIDASEQGALPGVG